MIAPSARLLCGHEGTRHNTASRAAQDDHPAAPPRPLPVHRSPLEDPAGQPARHPPPWNRSRRRPAHGQHTCRQQRRPVTTRSYTQPQFRGNPTPPRPSDWFGCAAWRQWSSILSSGSAAGGGEAICPAHGPCCRCLRSGSRAVQPRSEPVDLADVIFHRHTPVPPCLVRGLVPCHVRGHVKVPADGRVEVPAGGQQESPSLARHVVGECEPRAVMVAVSAS
jgi:hypothetical protein